jgi:DMSO/TMAO reductase YedYZ molybdopterin-dependent catalytic subunit
VNHRIIRHTDLVRRPSLPFGALAGALTSLPLIALSYLGFQLAGLPFVPFDLFDWLARVLPGDVVTVAIDTLVQFINTFDLGETSEVGKLIQKVFALVLVILMGALLGAIIAGVVRGSTWRGWLIGGIGGLIAFLAVIAIEFSLAVGIGNNPLLASLWLALLIIGWGALLGTLLDMRGLSTAPAAEATGTTRRAALLTIAAGSLGVAAGAWGVSRLLETPGAAKGASEPLPKVNTPAPPPVAATTVAADGLVEPAPGTRPVVTPNDEFYRIDINTRPVVIDADSWVLNVDGLFAKPRPLSLQDLMAYPTVTEPITLSCISNPTGGELIGTSYWTGVRLRDVLDDLGLLPQAQQLYVEGADGFYETVTMEDMLDPRTMLVYGMNEVTLPIAHGYPLRIYIPNRYGMKQPKWITRIAAISEAVPGYWVVRGWSKEARPNIISIIDAVATEHIVDGKVPVGGIAYEGAVPIAAVQVRVDDGEWNDAIVLKPPLGPLTWVQWRYDWPVEPGRHSFTVRAIDATGEVQVGIPSDPHPSGSTGYHTVVATI